MYLIKEISKLLLIIKLLTLKQKVVDIIGILKQQEYILLKSYLIKNYYKVMVYLIAVQRYIK